MFRGVMPGFLPRKARRIVWPEYRRTEGHGKGEYSVAEKGISGLAQRTQSAQKVEKR